MTLLIARQSIGKLHGLLSYGWLGSLDLFKSLCNADATRVRERVGHELVSDFQEPPIDLGTVAQLCELSLHLKALQIGCLRQFEQIPKRIACGVLNRHHGVFAQTLERWLLAILVRVRLGTSVLSLFRLDFLHRFLRNFRLLLHTLSRILACHLSWLVRLADSLGIRVQLRC